MPGYNLLVVQPMSVMGWAERDGVEVIHSLPITDDVVDVCWSTAPKLVEADNAANVLQSHEPLLLLAKHRMRSQDSNLDSRLQRPMSCH